MLNLESKRTCSQKPRRSVNDAMFQTRFTMHLAGRRAFQRPSGKGGLQRPTTQQLAPPHHADARQNTAVSLLRLPVPRPGLKATSGNNLRNKSLLKTHAATDESGRACCSAVASRTRGSASLAIGGNLFQLPRLRWH